MYRQIHDSQALGGDRLSYDDVRAVIDLWGDHQWGSDRATVGDVAEGLDITVEEVHALLEEVYARRTRVEIDVVEERERLALEQCELAAEQARLAKTERRLSNYDRERSDLHQLRLETRRRRVGLESGPALKSLKPVKTVRERPTGFSRPDSVPCRRAVLDSANAVLLILIGGGLVMSALWNIISAVRRALLP